MESNKDNALRDIEERLSDTMESENKLISSNMDNHPKAIPLTVMRGDDNRLNYYYLSANEHDIHITKQVNKSNVLPISLNPDFEMKKKHVLILGKTRNSYFLKKFPEIFEIFSESMS